MLCSNWHGRSPDRSGRRGPGGNVRAEDVGPSFVRLWAIVSLLWTLATALRVERLRLPEQGWQVLLTDPAFWLSVLVPPVALALMLAGIVWVASTYRRTRE